MTRTITALALSTLFAAAPAFAANKTVSHRAHRSAATRPVGLTADAAKPAEAKPAEAKPAEGTPAEAKPAEGAKTEKKKVHKKKAAEVKPAEKPADAAPATK